MLIFCDIIFLSDYAEHDEGFQMNIQTANVISVHFVDIIVY